MCCTINITDSYYDCKKNYSFSGVHIVIFVRIFVVVVFIKKWMERISFRFWLPEDNFGKILSQISVDKLLEDPGPKITLNKLFPKASFPNLLNGTVNVIC